MGTILPLGDASRRGRGFAWMTALIIAANAWVFFLELEGGNEFVRHWAVIPARIEHGHRLITIVTGMFMHAGWLHILGNMVFLWAFGPAIEDAMGRVRYLAFYLIGGIVAMLAQVAGLPGSHIPCLGASGAIAAVMGAFIVLFPRDRIRTLVWIFIFIQVTYIPAVLLIGVWFLMQLLNVVGSVADVQTGGVAYLAHVGGFLFGALTARLWAKKTVPSYYS
ncbi:MAG TPA: rhomboid family intramembrane serine protease [Terracidiphilus sp.]|nr:rhomboid family intramembrane serine protease [Terracidiphilus sp.]